jgi:hypothetical protein
MGSGVADFGDVAQLGERRVRNAKVESSILFISTKLEGPPCAAFSIWWAVNVLSGRRGSLWA